jgi:hypothetical protein
MPIGSTIVEWLLGGLVSIFLGIVFAACGGVAGLLIFVATIKLGWFDGPGGGMMVFPLVFVPAFMFGVCGFGWTLNKIRKWQPNVNECHDYTQR